VLKAIQSLGRKAFLAVEAQANRVFGERDNPFHHLGAISYWMFWLVVASGFYVYAFYDTGIDDTFESVEALTHNQWWAGGVMRSVHRYASDAMILTMLLHLVRHFCFDRYRSFRAFSWITGVIVLWLVYASGVNGYMLPWDRLAQFVLTATAEWFDALPPFRGVFVRNFVLEESITDRFFTLLQFLHIGIPLAVLAVLWVHTQRVPRAKTLPSRRIMIGSTVMLVVLSLVKPALSQGKANLASYPQSLEFDWFYLTVYPLFYSWSPMAVWALVGGLTLLFVLAPWLPPKRAGKTTMALTVHPGNRLVHARPGESLLDAGLRAGVALPFECRSGGCGVCKATLLAGDVDHGDYLESALSKAERAKGKLLLCCATALSDVEIEYEEGAAVREQPFGVYAARIERLDKLAHDVMLVALRLVGGKRIEFEAGQYINIILPDGDRRAYSFTTPSGETDLVELQVRRMPGGKFTTLLFEHTKVGDLVRFEGPIGAFILREPSERPLIFVAGATGFAPVKSLLEQAFKMGITRPLYFYWGVRKRRDLYLSELPERWMKEHPNFKFVPVLSEAGPDDEWTGRTGFVHEAILADFPDLSGFAIYACGSVKMVEAAKPAFVAQGLGEEFCFSDAFTAQKPAVVPT
jgi:NAD(P)H-flavin reductase/quinol-cytochrome oxidoreductase complex cytochrome b subunit